MTQITLEQVLQQRLRELREQAGLSQNALARVAKAQGLPWTQAHVGALERAERQLSLGELLLIAQRVFKVGWEDMVATPADSVLLAPGVAIRARELPSLCRLEARYVRISRTKSRKRAPGRAKAKRRRH